MQDIVRRLVHSESARATLGAACTRFMAESFGEDHILEPYIDSFSRAMTSTR
jgi:hypothetical protein